MRVGFVGLGEMGSPIGGNLISAGYRLMAFDPVGAAIETLEGLGASAASSPRDVADGSDVTVLMVRDAAQAEDAVRGEAGLLAGVGAGDVLIVMSSLPPALVRGFGEDLADLGAGILDAPVSGGVEGARAGSLTVMAAGHADVLDRCRPLLEVLGGRVYHVGEAAGLGQTMKALNQALYFTGLAVSAEAVVMGAKAGLDPEVLVEVIGDSSGGNWALENRVPLAWRDEYRSGGALSIAIKDLGSATELADELGVPALITSATANLFAITEGLLGAGGDDPLVVKAVEKIGRFDIPRRG